MANSDSSGSSKGHTEVCSQNGMDIGTDTTGSDVVKTPMDSYTQPKNTISPSVVRANAARTYLLDEAYHSSPYGTYKHWTAPEPGSYNPLFDRWVDWLMGWLIDWLIDGVVDWLIDWLIDWFYFNSLVFDGLVDWFIFFYGAVSHDLYNEVGNMDYDGEGDYSEALRRTARQSLMPHAHSPSPLRPIPGHLTYEPIHKTSMLSTFHGQHIPTYRAEALVDELKGHLV